MTLLRISTARHLYQCSNCSKVILKGRTYYRLEPYPIARIKGTEQVQHLCLDCGNGQFEQDKEPNPDWLKYYWVPKPIEIVETRVHIANVTSELIGRLIRDPNELYNLSPSLFEELICDRLSVMGFDLSRVGKHTFQKDGGIDIVAWPQKTTFPFLMAIQAKYHHSPSRKTGPSAVRELQGIVQTHNFQAGILVTNTAFTPDAKWIADQKPMLVRLRDATDLQRWLLEEFLDEYDWREFPDELEVCPGIVVKIPRPGTSRLYSERN